MAKSAKENPVSNQHVQHRGRPRRQLHLAAVAPELPGSGIKTK
jgi:hypothetical protein